MYFLHPIRMLINECEDKSVHNRILSLLWVWTELCKYCCKWFPIRLFTADRRIHARRRSHDQLPTCPLPGDSRVRIGFFIQIGRTPTSLHSNIRCCRMTNSNRSNFTLIRMEAHYNNKNALMYIINEIVFWQFLSCTTRCYILKNLIHLHLCCPDWPNQLHDRL